MSVAKSRYDIFKLQLDSTINETRPVSSVSALAIAEKSGKIKLSRGFGRQRKSYRSIIKLLSPSSVPRFLTDSSLGVSGIYAGLTHKNQLVTVRHCDKEFVECGAINFSVKGCKTLKRYILHLEESDRYIKNFLRTSKTTAHSMVLLKNFNKTFESAILLQEFYVRRQAAKKKEEAKPLVELSSLMQKITNYTNHVAGNTVTVNNDPTSFAAVSRDYVQALLFQTAIFLKFSKDSHVTLSVRDTDECVEIEASVNLYISQAFELQYHAISEILDSFDFITRYTNEKGQLCVCSYLPKYTGMLPELHDIRKMRNKVDEILSLPSVKNIFDFICDM